MPGILLLVVVCFRRVVFCFPKLSLHVIYTGAGLNLQRLEKAFHPELSSSVTTAFISKLELEHHSFITWMKGISTSSSSLLHMRWATVYPLLNSSGTTRLINGNLYWFVLSIASIHTILCACFWHIFNCFFVWNPNANMLFFKSILSYIFGPIIVFSP